MFQSHRQSDAIESGATQERGGVTILKPVCLSTELALMLELFQPWYLNISYYTDPARAILELVYFYTSNHNGCKYLHPFRAWQSDIPTTTPSEFKQQPSN